MAARKPPKSNIRVNPSTGASNAKMVPPAAQAAARRRQAASDVRTAQALAAQKAGQISKELPPKKTPKLMGKRPAQGRY